MNRDEMLGRVAAERTPWDIIVIGGGATGIGTAVDAASRGYRVLLLEQHDFGKATSSRSTKLVHGGVRYLRQGNIALVREALHERGLLAKNAPHLVHDMAFVIPGYQWWEKPYYALGMQAYALLAGKLGLGQSRTLSKRETLEQLPNLKPTGLRGSVLYYDGQFDDTRLLTHLAMTAAAHDAVLLNYAPVVRFAQHASGRVDGVVFRDLESGNETTVKARVIINATGVFCDQLRRLAEPSAAQLVAPSQGIHLVFERRFLPGDAALMVPQTRDGRVLFAIPWHGHTLVGTTDTPIESPSLEPRALDEEVEFILATARDFLATPPTCSDILSVFAGIRPLVRPRKGGKKSSSVSRDHTIHTDPSGIITITGGKWTTYRHMAEDVVDQAIAQAKLPEKACVTETLRIHGYDENASAHGVLAMYGTDASGILQLLSENPALAKPLSPALPYLEAEVIWAARHEMARSVEDVLARRTRALFLNARAASVAAPRVAALLAVELQQNSAWEQSQVTEFRDLAAGYLVS
ncbi:MAG TPA: FAD-dependent oxidoreductase [Pirellulaceae bacterium]|nr:FAD-dependent oxidoreductase [Pirellulaceae bacterium]